MSSENASNTVNTASDAGKTGSRLGYCRKNKNQLIRAYAIICSIRMEFSLPSKNQLISDLEING